MSLATPQRRLETILPFARHPVFWLVLALKLFAAALFGSHYVRDLFLPFIEHFIASGFQNPWDAFAAQGRLDAFPYSAPMLALLAAPQAVATWLAPGLVAESESLRLLLIRLPMLAADLAILAILAHWFQTKRAPVLWLYWCSPALFYVSYVHGQVDAIPTAFLFGSLAAVLARRPGWAGFLLGIGIASKLHVAVAVPFLFVFLLRNPAPSGPWRRVAMFASTLALTAAAGIVPFLGSQGYRTMVLGTRETARLFEVALPLTEHLSLYVAPIVLLWLFLRFAASAKVNRDLLIMMLAVTFGALVLLLPPMPGWYFWMLPLAAYFFVRQEAPLSPVFWGVSLLYVAYHTLFWTDPSGAARPLLDGAGWLPARVSAESLVFTVLQASLAMMLFRIYRLGIASNREYATGRRTTLVGIGGDSGSGKHTLGQALRDLLGDAQCTVNEGDDYHRFVRGDPAWKQLTHLDPRGSDLMRPLDDLVSLKGGRTVIKPRYDHRTGRFTQPQPLAPGRFVFFIGLHPFFIRRMRSLIDIKIQVAPDEALRRAWKARRDQDDRGYDAVAAQDQIARRLPDAHRYVTPQHRFADWVFSCRPGTPSPEPPPDAPLSVANRLSNDLDLGPLSTALASIPGVTVRWEPDPDMERQVLDVAGTPGADDIRTIAYRAFPNLEELIENESPRWHGGSLGIGQLIFLALLDDHARGESTEPPP